MRLPPYNRSDLSLVLLLILSGCGSTANEGQRQAGPALDNSDPMKESSGDGDGNLSAGDGDGTISAQSSNPIVCASEDTFEDLSELPLEIARGLLRTTSLELDGVTTGFSLVSGIEDDGVLLWFGSEAGDTHNLLFEVASDSWSLIDGEAYEPWVALGGQFLAFEKVDNDVDLSLGYRFDPASSTWTPLPALDPPLLRQRQLEVLTENGYFVWGGWGKVGDTTQYSLVANGGYLDASTWNWTPVSTTGAPSPRFDALIASAGELVLIYGGSSPSESGANPEPLSDGYRYDPQTNSWSPMSVTAGLPQAGSVAASFGSKLLVIGSDSDLAPVGAIYDSLSDTWAFADMSGGPPANSMLQNITPPGSLDQLVFVSGSGPRGSGDVLFIYDVRADSWRSHFLASVFPTFQAGSASDVGARTNMDYYWHEGSLIIWGGDVTVITYCDDATRAANPGVGCDAKEDVYHLSDGKRLHLSCPD